MKSKLQHSVSELEAIKNQIRVELNQVRQTREKFYPDRHLNVSKRIFSDKYGITSLKGPESRKQNEGSTPTKKLYDKNNIRNSEFNKITERKHFQQKFADKVELKLNTRKKQSCYLRNMTEGPENYSVSPIKQQQNTSLIGIGVAEKSPTKGKRIMQNYHIFKQDFI